MTIGIYGIFDARDGSCLYVGQSKIIEERWKGHLNRLRLGKHLRSEFNDHFLEIEKDESLLDFRILEECEDLDEVKNHLEMKWFSLLAPRFYGKKPTLNGKWTHSEETKTKIGQGIVKSEKVRAKVLLLEKKRAEKLCLACNLVPARRKRKTCSNQCSTDLLSRSMTAISEMSYNQLYQLWVIENVSLADIAKSLDCSTTSAYRILGNHNLPTKKREVTQLRKELGLEKDPTRQCVVCPNAVTSSNKRAKTCSSVCRYKLRDISTYQTKTLQLV
jgi:hypothetical protein